MNYNVATVIPSLYSAFYFYLRKSSSPWGCQLYSESLVLLFTFRVLTVLIALSVVWGSRILKSNQDVSRFFSFLLLLIILIYLLIMLLQLSHFPLPSLHSILPTPSLPHSPPYSSCPWVILVSSLASTFPTLFLPSPCLFYTYHLCYLFSVPFSPLSPSQSPIDNPPCDLHFCGSVSVLVVCLVFFCFGFRCGC